MPVRLLTRASHLPPKPPGFQQPGRIRLYYDGVMIAYVHGTEATIDMPIDPAGLQL